MKVALMGLGGAGKSAVMETLGFHAYVGSPKVPKVNLLKKYLVWLLPFYYVFDAWIDQFRSNPVITDRCYLDRFVSLAAHKTLPIWYLSMFIKWIPKPEYVFFLNISPETAYNRKHEHEVGFIENEQTIMRLFLWDYLSEDRVLFINAEKNDVLGVTSIVNKALNSISSYGDVWAQFIFEKDYSIFEQNWNELFDKCWKNRMVFHYFDYVPEIKRMINDFDNRRFLTIFNLPMKVTTLDKAKYQDVETDLDVLIKDGILMHNKNENELELDIHTELNYFGYTFGDPTKIGLYHAVFETGTCIMRDYYIEMDVFFDKKSFPRRLTYSRMIQNCLLLMSPKLAWNYLRVIRAWRKGKLPYYEPVFSREDIWRLIK